MPAAQDVEMEMEYRLAGVASGVRNDPIAGLRQPLLFRHVGTGYQELSQEIGVLIAAVLYRCHMFFRDDKGMDRRLRVDIVKGQRAIILVHDLGRDRLLNNLAK
jgi:hypothetical protein